MQYHKDFGDYHCFNKKVQVLLPLQAFFYSLCRNILVEGIPCTPSKPIKDSWHLSNQHITWMTFPKESIDAYMDTNDWFYLVTFFLSLWQNVFKWSSISLPCKTHRTWYRYLYFLQKINYKMLAISSHMESFEIVQFL